MRNRIANNTRTETLGLYGSWQNSSHIPYPAIERYEPFIADPGASDIARVDIYLSYRLNGTGFARFSRTAFLRRVRVYLRRQILRTRLKLLYF